MSVEVQRFDDAQTFLDEAGPFLAEREAEHNLLFGIAETIAVDPDRYRTRGSPYFAAVRRDDEVVLAAVWTPPYNPVLSMTEDADAVKALAADLAHAPTAATGVTAAPEVARRFIDAWSAKHQVTARMSMAERIYRVEHVVPPVGVEGSMRVATDQDRALLIDYMCAFMAEIRDDHDDAATIDMVDSALQTGSRTFYVWEVDGRPVSVAGISGPTPNGIRLGPVYTPPQERRHGYASAVTAGASQAQLDDGRRFVFLFTDLANPTSNHIYQEIGYEPVIDVDEWMFEPVDPS